MNVFDYGTPEFRFQPPGPRDEPRTIARCIDLNCGGEIYVGDEVVRFTDGLVHEHCEVSYLRKKYVIDCGIIAADGSLS
jgi:hypothetical protein